MRQTKHAFARLLSATAALLLLLPAAPAPAQDDDPPPSAATMRPLLRGKNAAVSSMRPEATEAARAILQAGGNAFDAVVAGQAALAVTDFALNGVGSDAVILLYDAKSKRVVSINAEPPAPKLATIEWYKKNSGGKIPSSDGLLSGALPTVVDAWYLLLDHWGTMSFEQVLQSAIRLADEGFPISERLARTIQNTRKIRKYPSTMQVYQPKGQAPRGGDIFKNPDLASTLRKLIEAEKAAASKGRHEALKAARDRFYKGDIAREMAKFSEDNGGLFRYQDFADYVSKIETPVSINYRGYQVYKNPSASQGPAELFALNLLEGYDLKKLGHNSADYIHTNVEAIKLAMADREKYLGDMDFLKIPYDGLLSKDYARERRKLIDPAKASLELRPGTPPAAAKTGRLDDPRSPERPIHVNLDGHADHEGDTSYIGGRRQAAQHGQLRAQPAQRFRHRGGDGQDRHHLQLPGRLLLPHPGRGHVAPARQAPAQHPPEHAGDERRPAVHDHRQPRRRRSDHAHHADPDQRHRLRHEHPAGDRVAALVLAQLPGLALPPHHVSGRHVGRGADRRADPSDPPRPRAQAPRLRPLVARRQRRHHHRPAQRRPQRRRRPPRRSLRLGLVTAGSQAARASSRIAARVVSISSGVFRIPGLKRAYSVA